jgi:hypothetical protein
VISDISFASDTIVAVITVVALPTLSLML